MVKRKVEEPKVSPYSLMTNWFRDGSKTSPIPKELEDDKSISPHIILYYFMGSKYSIYINKYFNNWDIYRLDRNEILKMMKVAIQTSGYQQKYIKNFKDSKSKIFKALSDKFKLLKPDDLNLLGDIIENEGDEALLEMLGISNPKKIKAKKTKIKEQSKEDKSGYSYDKLMSKFKIEE